MHRVFLTGEQLSHVLTSVTDDAYDNRDMPAGPILAAAAEALEAATLQEHIPDSAVRFINYWTVTQYDNDLGYYQQPVVHDPKLPESWENQVPLNVFLDRIRYRIVSFIGDRLVAVVPKE